MKRAFRNTNFRPDSLARIAQMDSIVREYARQNLRLTARQLYYQFVSRDFIPNTPRSYKNLTSLLADARYAGLVDWDAIEDRGREADTPSQWENISGLVDSAARAFRLPRWRGQDTYAELWVEKQALAGVLEPLAREFHVTLMVNKGYSSASAMYASAQRIQQGVEACDSEQEATVFYLGDHDPSGEDMVRDITDRLTEFGCDVNVEKLALTMEQVRQYNPPPNPAKTTDSRYAAYAAEHGGSSWEVDALPPNVLSQIIRDAFENIIDGDLMDAIKTREQTLIGELRTAARTLDETVSSDEE
jgi:hypothetical protein